MHVEFQYLVAWVDTRATKPKGIAKLVWATNPLDAIKDNIKSYPPYPIEITYDKVLGYLQRCGIYATITELP